MEDYEIESNKEIEKNKKLLEDFATWLKESNLTEKTINKHIDNVGFYINDYLLYSSVIKAKDGIDEIYEFLGDWFIRKVMWSSKAEIKSNASSLKKFYIFMESRGVINDAQLEELKTTIKTCLPDWLESMQNYENMVYDDF